MAHILIVDDDADVRETISTLVERHGMAPCTAATLAEARDLLGRHEFHVVMLDLSLPDGDGMSLLPSITRRDPAPEVIVLTGKGDVDGAEKAIREGAWDYLLKPSPLKDILLSLNRAVKHFEQKEGSSTANLRALDLSAVVGESPAMRAVFEHMAQAAGTDAGVLITGETGSGKELIARTIHRNSRRAQQITGGNFVAVDCASITESLVESTLFGHKRGAFTGASSDREGLVQLADKGTLFLDEVGELTPAVQRSFLRVLQERRFRPVGGVKEHESDFRLISATNRNLNAMAKAATFRTDLLYRLRTIHIHLPPLRERREDLRPLARLHIDRLAKRYRTETKGLGADFVETLAAHEWPGNVRELFATLEQAFLTADNQRTLYAKHLPDAMRSASIRARSVADAHTTTVGSPQHVAIFPATPDVTHDVTPPPRQDVVPTTPDTLQPPQDFPLDSPLPPLKEYKREAEAHYLRRLREVADGDVPRMLELSGLSRSHLYTLLKRHNL